MTLPRLLLLSHLLLVSHLLLPAPWLLGLAAEAEDRPASVVYGGVADGYAANRPLAWWRLQDLRESREAVDVMRLHHGAYRVEGYAFDGDSHVNLGAVDIDAPQMSILAWFRADNFEQADGRLVSKATGTDREDHYWMLSTVAAKKETRLRGRLRIGKRTHELIADDKGRIDAEQWMLAAMTYDGRKVRLYLNGQLAAQVSARGKVAVNSHCEAWIGDNPSGRGSRPFRGRIEDVALFDAALSAPVLRAIFEARRDVAAWAGREPATSEDSAVKPTQQPPQPPTPQSGGAPQVAGTPTGGATPFEREAPHPPQEIVAQPTPAVEDPTLGAPAPQVAEGGSLPSEQTIRPTAPCGLPPGNQPLYLGQVLPDGAIVTQLPDGASYSPALPLPSLSSPEFPPSAPAPAWGPSGPAHLHPAPAGWRPLTFEHPELGAFERSLEYPGGAIEQTPGLILEYLPNGHILLRRPRPSVVIDSPVFDPAPFVDPAPVVEPAPESIPSPAAKPDPLPTP